MSNSGIITGTYYSDRNDPLREVFVGGVVVSPLGAEEVYYFHSSISLVAHLSVDAFKTYFYPTPPKAGETWEARTPNSPDPRVAVLGVGHMDGGPDIVMYFSTVETTKFKRLYLPVDKFLERYGRPV